MTDRLFVPAAFAGLLAGMPPATASAFDRLDWLDRTYERLRREVAGPHGLSAIRLAQWIDQVRHATHREFLQTIAAAGFGLAA
ncbi:hypothetical protein SAMN04489727_2144 [Amycolatopsis tolypomycina]|uniref:Uncharacterized protein n=1 Tax=Amycolatopsis tolypomycina TaxID=208445 RepID=A0A1H4JSK9_9PSEU|nr:hypothetical protein [Amycolatopsis tolypomycina]SEB28762.1 hypothetical protein SAMN04489727_0007 [Amycolatopsis tolypomycina]SEB48976.1 hypothetical protein SAMN04489727_2144 [Amycolatopsis tolypomycina]